MHLFIRYFSEFLIQNPPKLTQLHFLLKCASTVRTNCHILYRYIP